MHIDRRRAALTIQQLRGEAAVARRPVYRGGAGDRPAASLKPKFTPRTEEVEGSSADDAQESQSPLSSIAAEAADRQP